MDGIRFHPFPKETNSKRGQVDPTSIKRNGLLEKRELFSRHDTCPSEAKRRGGSCLYSSRMFIVINLAGGNSVLPEVRAFCTIVVRDRSLGRNSTGTRNSLLMSSRFPPPSIPPPLLRFQTSFHRTFSDPGTASTWLELVITSRSYRA